LRRAAFGSTAALKAEPGVNFGALLVGKAIKCGANLGVGSPVAVVTEGLPTGPHVVRRS
jgi:hypothetical protein